jgi:serine/threonine protein kinase
MSVSARVHPAVASPAYTPALSLSKLCFVQRLAFDVLTFRTPPLHCSDLRCMPCSSATVRAVLQGKIKCFMGTAEFMAPEIVALKRHEGHSHQDCSLTRAHAVGFDQSADIWALGVVLYECLCGHRPWSSTDEVWLSVR